MNSKIKIVTKHQEISNEEFEQLMDFNTLLTKYNHTRRGGTWITWTSVIVFLALTSSIALYVGSQENDIEKVVLDQAQPTPPALKRLVPDSIGVKENNVKKLEQTVTTQSIEKSVEGNHEEASEIITEEEKKDVIPLTEEKEEKRVEEVKVAPVYIPAEPVNGYTDLYEYFNHELIYPPDAVRDSVQGILKVSFVIDRNGNVGNLQFINSLGKLFEEEAARLIENMPAWKPATLDGQPVLSKRTLPLTFKIQPVEKNKTSNNN